MKPINVPNALIVRESPQIQSITAHVCVMESISKNLTRDNVLIHVPQFLLNIMGTQQQDSARRYAHLDTFQSMIPIDVKLTAQQLHLSPHYCFSGTMSTGNVSQNVLIHSPMPIHSLRIETVTPPAHQELMPPMPKIVDASLLVLTMPLINFMLTSTNA